VNLFNKLISLPTTTPLSVYIAMDFATKCVLPDLPTKAKEITDWVAKWNVLYNNGLTDDQKNQYLEEEKTMLSVLKVRVHPIANYRTVFEPKLAIQPIFNSDQYNLMKTKLSKWAEQYNKGELIIPLEKINNLLCEYLQFQKEVEFFKKTMVYHHCIKMDGLMQDFDNIKGIYPLLLIYKEVYTNREEFQQYVNHQQEKVEKLTATIVEQQNIIDDYQIQLQQLSTRLDKASL
jgi:hypothetical protein